MNIEDQFLFGDSILVAPIYKVAEKGRKIYFPEPGALYFNPSNWHKKHSFQSPISNLTNNWSLFWEELSNKCKQNTNRIFFS